MDYERAHEMYQECLDMNLSEMLDLISDETIPEHERDFYVELYNFTMRTRQKECIEKGIF